MTQPTPRQYLEPVSKPGQKIPQKPGNGPEIPSSQTVVSPSTEKPSPSIEKPKLTSIEWRAQKIAQVQAIEAEKAKLNREQAEQAKILNLDAAAKAQTSAEQEAAKLRYRQEWERRKAEQEKESALKELQEQEERRRELEALRRDNEQRQAVVASQTNSEEVLAYEQVVLAEQEVKRNSGAIEAWLAKVNPAAAKTRQAIEDAIAKLQASLAKLLPEATDQREEVQKQIDTLNEELKSVVDSEGDIWSMLSNFKKMGLQAYEWITEFVKNFYSILRKKFDRILSLFHLVFMEIIPKLVSNLTAAVVEPFKKMAQAAWKGIKYVGEKISDFSSGFVSGIKWLKAKGGQIASDTYQTLKGAYSSVASAVGMAGSKISTSASYFPWSQTLWLVWKAGGKVVNAGIILVNGVWKVITSPTTQMILAAITKYISNIWTDPLWGKLIMEVVSMARETICEKVSNYIYTPSYLEVNAFDKASEVAGSVASKIGDIGAFGIWEASTNFLTQGGLKDSMTNLGKGLAEGVKANLSFSKVLGGLGMVGGGPLGAGAAAALGSAIDGALFNVIDESSKAMAEAAEQSAQLAKKKAVLLEHFDFWIKFFTSDCVYERQYTYNPEGWTRSTVDFLTLGLTAKNRAEKIPLTKEHIDLENENVKLRALLTTKQAKIQELESNPTRQGDSQLSTELATVRAESEDLRKTIADNELRCLEYLAEAKQRKQETEKGIRRKGLWDGLNMTTNLESLTNAVDLRNWIFNQSDLANAASIQNDRLKNYFSLQNQTAEALLVKVKQSQILIDEKTVELEKKMIELKNLQQQSGQGSWNPINWVMPADQRTLSDLEKKTIEIQKLNKTIDDLSEQRELADSEYMSLIQMIIKQSRYQETPSEEEIVKIERLAALQAAAAQKK